MRRFLLGLLSIVFLCFSFNGCLAEELTVSNATSDEILLDGVSYPLYESLGTEDKQLYLNICSAVMQFKDSAAIAVYDNKEDLEKDLETIESLYRQIFFEQSEIFWVDPYSISLEYTESLGGYKLFIKPNYLVASKDVSEMKRDLNEVLEDIANQAKAKENLFESLLFVHDYILEKAEYDYALAESDDYNTTRINAYGCLLEGKTICSGYTLAFDAVLKRMGIECGAEFNNYSRFSLIDGHVWNYCKLEGDYYYFDLTWDDTSFDSDTYKPYFDFGYTYFGVNREELASTNYFMTEDAPTPDCNGTKFNYYAYRGLNLSEYTKEAAEAALKAQEGQSFAVMRFDSYGELLKAQTDLIEDGEIFSILSDVDSVSYAISKSNLHLFIFLK